MSRCRRMARRFTKHYTREEARALLPELRRWLRRLQALSRYFENHDQQLGRLLASGADMGGPQANLWVRLLVDLNEVWALFRRRQVEVKDLERGLVDFPSLREGREVFLCWEQGEEDIGYWHELDAGYAGRTSF